MFLDFEIAKKELKTVAQGKRAHVPIEVLADYVLRYCTRDSVAAPAAPVRNDDSVRWCERLYRLEDRRV